MNPYELILLFDPVLGEDKIGTVITKIEDKIKAAGGQIDRTEKWGVRRLASMMKKAKKLTQAYYTLIRFNSPSSAPAELRAYLRVNENVVRSYISRAVELPLPVEEKIEGKAIEAVEIGEIKSVEEESELGKP